MGCVRFTDAAIEDLEALQRKDPQRVRQVLKKCLLLERDPEAGQPLLGELIGYRKLVVGNRDWRPVWRVTEDGDIEIAEVWRVGARSDDEIYNEMTARVAALPPTPMTKALFETVEVFAPQHGIEAQAEPQRDPVPKWLRERLVHTAGLSAKTVDELTGAEAADRWDRYMREHR